MASMNAFPSDPAGELAAADNARLRLTSGLRLPSWFHISLGVAVAVQIAATAYGVAAQSAAGLVVVAAGCLVFFAVAWLQVRRFRRLNGVRVAGLTSRAVLGTSSQATLAEVAGLGGAIWAAFEGQPWLVGLAAIAGGAGYALSAHFWWRGYLADPAGHARAESRAAVLGYGVLTVAGIILLVVLR
jgi:hypothetical protein